MTHSVVKNLYLISMFYTVMTIAGPSIPNAGAHFRSYFLIPPWILSTEPLRNQSL